VSVRKSTMDTTLKNPNASNIKTLNIPIVIKTENKALKKSAFSMNHSFIFWNLR